MVILTLLFLGLKYYGQLLRYLGLPPWVNVLKLFYPGCLLPFYVIYHNNNVL